MSPFNHQQKCLTDGICGLFDMKSNHVGKVIPKKPKNLQKLDKRAIKCKKRVSKNRSKTTSL